PDDEAGLRDMFFQMSDDTRYYYFFTGVPATAHWAQRFTALGAGDGLTSYVLLAQAEERIVGLARFDRTAGTTEAEIGILLVDGWQSRGLGQRMIARLAGEARERGITTFIGRVLGENRRALALARRTLPGVRIAWTSGEFELRACLEPAPGDTEKAGDR
ncbi:MAG: GNAT family N-acetyltransferase, partial [Ktedonobacterales bacterium]